MVCNSSQNNPIYVNGNIFKVPGLGIEPRTLHITAQHSNTKPFSAGNSLCSSQNNTNLYIND